jgi:hypothetical protein
LWQAVVQSAAQLNGRAWLFTHPTFYDRYTEFVEWPANEEPPIIERAPLREALRELTDAFPSEESGTWQQASI